MQPYLLCFLIFDCRKKKRNARSRTFWFYQSLSFSLSYSLLFHQKKNNKIGQRHGGEKEVTLLMIFSPYCVHHRVLETGCFIVLEEVRHQAQPTYEASYFHLSIHFWKSTADIFHCCFPFSARQLLWLPQGSDATVKFQSMRFCQVWNTISQKGWRTSILCGWYAIPLIST